MKRFILIGVLVVTACAAYSQSAKDYSAQATQQLMRENLKEEGLFRYVVVPLPIDFLVITQYATWIEKRYSKERMIAEAKTLAEQAKGTLRAILLISFTGDFMSKGRTELKIPDDFAEYVFVENETGTYFPCAKADVPLMGGTVNSISDSTQVSLDFNVTDALYEGAKTMRFTIGGLELQDKTFEYQLPYSSNFQDCPKEIREILISSGIWK